VTPGLAAMLLGVFAVPAALLWMGHRLRRRPAAWRNVFWGALAGHVAAMVLGLIFGMTPPEEWSDTDYLRGAMAFWSFVVLPLVGGAAGWLRGR
jgi:hypothetical protein